MDCWDWFWWDLDEFWPFFIVFREVVGDMLQETHGYHEKHGAWLFRRIRWHTWRTSLGLRGPGPCWRMVGRLVSKPYLNPQKEAGI